jgi:two-component system catabolic regulation response regulator CreB
MSSILLIEDESAIADNVIYALQAEGIQVHWTELGQDGLQRLRQGGIDLAILDVGLPDSNGFELCKAIRGFSDLPIIFLTARAEEIDRIVGLEIGADDYVTKPFSPRELAARVKAHLRRLQPADADNPAGFVIDRGRARIAYCAQWLNLTPYEFRILDLLLGQPERVFSRAQIMDGAWHEPEAAFDRAVDTHIKTLRAKLKAIGSDPITTHRGLGYSIQGPVRET